jgi:hypothetical protein
MGAVRVLLSLATPLLAALALATGAAAIKLPPPPNLPAGWSHATINVVIRRVPHTFTYDHGRVAGVSPTSLTLHEPDGSIVTVGIDSSTVVRIAGRLASVADVRRLDIATTVTVDGGAAALVKVQPRTGR